MRNKLIHAVTEYDRRESRKKSYNSYALGIYMERVDAVIADIDAGADPRKAIMAGFNDRLLDFVLKSVGLPISTKEESLAGGYIYNPIAKK